MLEEWEEIESEEEEEDESESVDEDRGQKSESSVSRTLTFTERFLPERVLAALQANQERDPKYDVARQCLLERRWLERGCIIFSQYRDSVQWLAE